MATFKFLRPTFGFLQHHALLPTRKHRNKSFPRLMSGKADCVPARAMVILAPGVEETEAVIVIDVLRRAGVNVTTAGLDGKEPIKTMHGINILPDTCLKQVEDEEYHALILPGGLESTKAIAESELAGEVLTKQEKCCRIIAAICAAPLALDEHCIGYGRRITSYPALKDKLEINYLYKDKQKVCVDENLITSQGPGTAFAWAIKLTEMLKGKEKAKQISLEMLLPPL